MRTEWRNMRVPGGPSMARVGLSSAAIIGIAIGGLMVPRPIACAQAGPTFEVSPATAGGRRGGPGRGAGYNLPRISRTPLRIAFRATLVPDIMAFAYGLPLDRIERRPQWMYSRARSRIAHWNSRVADHRSCGEAQGEPLSNSPQRMGRAS
jgi:hypothetical protein